jgi:hypothetical protein
MSAVMKSNVIDLTPVSNVATLSSSAMLVDLTISQWSGRKLDKRVSDEIDRDNNTATKVVRANKDLLAGDSSLADIRTAGNMLRNYHDSVTMPWSKVGPRLLPTSLFMEYKKVMSKLEQTYSEKVNDFLNEYTYKVSQARYTLGSLYNSDDYPSTSDIQGRFKIEIRYLPLPEANDWRLDIGNQGMTDLRNQYETLYNDSISNAMSDIWSRLYDSLTRLSNGLRIEEGKRGIIVGSTFDNAKELCDLLSHLNISGDTKLESMRQSLESAMYGLDVTDVRNSDYQRTLLKSSVDDILGKF